MSTECELEVWPDLWQVLRCLLGYLTKGLMGPSAHFMQLHISVCHRVSSCMQTHKCLQIGQSCSLTYMRNTSLKSAAMAATSLQTFVKWGFWGWAVSTSWTQASLTKPCLLCQPQLYYQKWGSCQSAAIAPHSSRCNSLSLQPVSHTMEMYGQEIGVIAAYSHQHAFDSNLQEIRKSLR